MKDYFCGWYFKCQSDSHTLAIIPAIHTHGNVPSCSIQLISELGNWTIPLPWQEVEMCQSCPRAVLGPNQFSPQGVKLAICSPHCLAAGTLRFGPPSPIRYDIMGPFCCLPMLECRHSVFSMRHRVEGALTINGTLYRFHNAVGYIEGDRGRSFPRQYAWTQCLFPNGSLMLSVAEIPLGPIRFTGVIGIVRIGSQEYRLATYLGARAVSIAGGSIVVRQGDLQLTASLLERTAYPLHAPSDGQMNRIIRENVCCAARYQLQCGRQILLELDSPAASFEYEY